MIYWNSVHFSNIHAYIKSLFSVLLFSLLSVCLGQDHKTCCLHDRFVIIPLISNTFQMWVKVTRMSWTGPVICHSVEHLMILSVLLRGWTITNSKEAFTLRSSVLFACLLVQKVEYLRETNLFNFLRYVKITHPKYCWHLFMSTSKSIGVANNFLVVF